MNSLQLIVADALPIVIMALAATLVYAEPPGPKSAVKHK